MPNCLMVAYYFPPGGGVGVLRSLKFARYLPVNGWRPLVLTTYRPLGIPQDERLLEQMPAEGEVVRIAPWFSTEACFDASNRLARLFLVTCLIPDANMPWVPRAVRAGLRAIREQSARVIYTSSPPHSTHLVGLALKKKTGLPWVADFRDAWITDPDRNRSIHNRLRGALVEKRQERQVVMTADRILTVSEPIRTDFLTRYPQLKPERVLIIPNGYDPQDFAGIERQPSPVYRFVFTGSLSKQHRGPEPLLEGAQTLLAQRPELAGCFEVLLVGPFSLHQKDLPARYALQGTAILLGSVDYLQALTHQVNADVNVMIYSGPPDGRSAQMMSTKIFEYAGAGRPVLVIAPSETSATRLVQDLMLGVAVEPGNPQAVADAMYSMIRSGSLVQTSNEQLVRYQRQFQAQQLADLFNNLAAVNRAER